MRRLTALLLVLGVVLLATGGSASADVITPKGDCGASGKWTRAKFTERSAKHVPDDVITIPRRDVVVWRGNVRGGDLVKPGERRDISGSLVLDLPLGQSVTVEDWDGSTVLTAKRNRRGYNLPVFFTGVKMKLHGHHDENGKRICSGSVYLKVDGSATSNPLTWAGVAGIVLSGGVLVFAGRRVARTVGTAPPPPVEERAA
jgi:hypothetical protein